MRRDPAALVYRWWRPPTLESATTLPALGGSPARATGASFSVLGELARLAEIFCHEFDLRRRPPQLARAIHELELALGAGAVVENLRGARLPRVHEGTSLLMLSEDLGMKAHDL